MKNEKWILGVLAALQFTHIVDFMIMMPLGDVLMKLFHISPQQFSILVSSYTFSAAIFGFLGAFIIDRFDRKKFLLTAYIGFTIGTFACAIAPSYEWLCLARIVTGAFGGSIAACVLSIIGDIIPIERRGTAMGVVMTSFSIASIFGVPFSLFIANKTQWHVPFIMIGSLSAVISVMIYFVLPNINAHLEKARENPIIHMVNLLKRPSIQLAVFFMLMLVLGQFTIIPFITPYNIRNVGILPEQVPFIYIVGGAVSIIVAPVVGRLSDKMGKKLIFYVFAAFSIIPLLLITNMGHAPLWFVLVAAGLLFIGFGGRMIPAQTLMTAVVEPHNRGAFMSLNSSIQQLGMGIGSYIAGLIIYENTTTHVLYNYEKVGYLAVGFSIVAMFMVGKLRILEGAAFEKAHTPHVGLEPDADEVAKATN